MLKLHPQYIAGYHQCAKRKQVNFMMAIKLSFVAWVALLATTAAQGNLLRRRTISDSDVEACYENLPSGKEVFNLRQWWNVSIPPQFAVSSSFFRSRLPFQPLDGSDTVIAGVLFSLSGGTLKLSAFFPPLYPQERKVAGLMVNYKGVPVAVGQCNIRSNTGYCGFRVDNLVGDDKSTDDYDYEVVYLPNENDSNLVYKYGGKLPLPKENPNIAALSCFGRDDDDKELDKRKLVASVLSKNPDILLLQGDQVYERDHLGFGFLRLIFSIQELTRSTPTIVQMDDHDYGLGNLWGAEKTEDDDSGSGFTRPVCLVNALQELCMGHNPDPATTATLDNGITIHYGNYEYGRFDLAILEVRKFKNKIVGDSLLGDGQEAWLSEWCSSNDRVKIVLAQTPFAALGTYVTYYKGGMSNMTEGDTDTNGFPVPGRTRAMEIMQGCTSLILSGDQHMAVAVSYEDYQITECASPAVVNSIWWRLNMKPPGQNYLDLYGNNYTLHAAWNVDPILLRAYRMPLDMVGLGVSDEVKEQRADGFLMVNIIGDKAVCSAETYRASQQSMWEYETSLSLATSRRP